MPHLPQALSLPPSTFIAIEGIDGSGKSTQAKLLAERLHQQGQAVHLTFEPTRGEIGNLLRRIFNHQKDADHRTIAALFAADRLEHILDPQEGLLHHLHKGAILISDRYYFSSYAYHSVHCNMQWVMDCNRMAASLLRPSLTLFVDVPPSICMQRIAQNRAETQLYETIDNLTAVREKYWEAFEKTKVTELVKVVDGMGSHDEVAARIADCLRATFKLSA